MRRALFAFAAATTLCGTAFASDRDAAREAFRDGGDMACVRELGGTLDVGWTAVDLNADGRDEYVVRVGGFGNGASSCFGQAGATVHLMTRTATGWRQEFGVPGIDLVPRPRGVGQWADLEIGGPGFCLPVWRNDGAGYRPHQTC